MSESDRFSKDPTCGMTVEKSTALPAVRERFPSVRILFAGQHENVLGEAAYKERLRPLLAP